MTLSLGFAQIKDGHDRFSNPRPKLVYNINDYTWVKKSFQALIESIALPQASNNAILRVFLAIEDYSPMVGFSLEDVDEKDSRLTVVRAVNAWKRQSYATLWEKIRPLQKLTLDKDYFLKNEISVSNGVYFSNDTCEDIEKNYLVESILLTLLKPNFARADLGYLDDVESQSADFAKDRQRAKEFSIVGDKLKELLDKSLIPKQCRWLAWASWARRQFAINAPNHAPLGVAGNMCGRSLTAHWQDSFFLQSTENFNEHRLVDTFMMLSHETPQNNATGALQHIDKVQTLLQNISDEEWLERYSK